MLFLLPFVFAFCVFVLSPVVTGWPTGTYGLIKAFSGCPGGNVEWQSGSRTFDTEDYYANNEFNFNRWNESYLAGVFEPNDITIEFCMKMNNDLWDWERWERWPQGTYCILKKNNCPTGFNEGSIFWDDEDAYNHNSFEGVMPDGTYNDNTEMFFCCRSDAEPETAMYLISNEPFVLLRYGHTCQKVEVMYVSEVFVRWDDEDYFNRDSTSGHHPFDDGGSDDHKLHFCHYSPIIYS